MADEDFFKTATPRSLVKIDIVTKYFWSWSTALKSKVVGRGDKMTFLDLYCGPGSYTEDGIKSTPLRVLETIIREPDLQQLVATVFNDADPEHCKTLKASIAQLPGINLLRYKPIVTNHSVNESMIDRFLNTKPGPVLLFLDPFGYKGLSVDLIWSVVKNFGSDCIFFFNYRRVNAGLPNLPLNEPIDALFSKPRADALREKIKPLTVDEREQVIIENITEALQVKGGKCVQGFRFVNDAGTRTNHFLIFVSKKDFALGLIKSIMAKQSSALGSEIPSFEFNPAQEKKLKDQQAQMRMFDEEEADDIDKLAEGLLSIFQGEMLTTEQVYQKHHAGTPYIEANYRSALLRLEERKSVTCNPSFDDRVKKNGKATLGKNVVITFPKKTS